LLQLLDQLEASISELDLAVAEQASTRPAAQRFRAGPGSPSAFYGFRLDLNNDPFILAKPSTIAQLLPDTIKVRGQQQSPWRMRYSRLFMTQVQHNHESLIPQPSFIPQNVAVHTYGIDSPFDKRRIASP